MVGQAYNGAEDNLNARHGSVYVREWCGGLSMAMIIPSRRHAKRKTR